VPGRVVQLAATGSGNSVTQPASVTDAAGVATGALRSTVAEVKTITATVDPGAGEVVLAAQPTVELVADASHVSAALSSAVATPAQDVVADGATTSAITVTLRDPHGNPIPGLAVQLAATGTDNTLVQPAGVTDASGTASGSLASTRAEVKVVTVTADPGGQGVVLLQTPTIELVGDPSTISATGSFASANPTTGVYANGLDHSTIDVVVRDAHGNAVEGQTVFLSSTGTSNTFTQPAGPTDGNGSASGTLASTTSELKTITVTVNPGPSPVELVQKPTVEFIADTTVSPSLSTVTVLPVTNVVADGVETSTVTVTVRDGLNNLVSGAVVWIAASGTGNTITQPVGPTNGAGQAQGTLASVVAETKTVEVTVNPGPDAVVLDDLPTVAFIANADQIDDTLSSVVASPSTGVAADGSSLSTITVTVRDDHGNPVPDQAVSLAATGSGNTLTQPAGLTDAAGVASGTLASTVAETKTLTVTVEPGASQVVLATQPTVEFIPDAIDAGLSSVVAVPSTNVVADGTSVSTITVTVLDTLGNPVPGQTVQLAATGTDNTLTQPAAVTDAAGVATGTLASTHAESKSITATVNPGAGQVVLDDHPTIGFIADASNVSAALSSVVATPSTGVVADGSTSSTLTITVRDAHGNPVSGRSVLLAATGSGSTLTQPAGTTDAAGVVTGALASTVAAVKTVTATVDPGPGEVVLAQQPTVEFVADPSTIDPALSSVVASPSVGVVADGIDASTTTVTVRDPQGNPVPGQTVQVACSGTGNTVTPPAGPTDAAGLVTATLRSTVAETKAVTVTVNPGASAVVLAHQPTVELVADADAVNAALSTVVATPSADVVADGATLSTITITVVDTHGNPISGKTVQLAATGTGNTVVQPAAVTDAAGETTGTLASTVAEDKVVTATVDPGPGEVVLAQAPTVGFVADPGAISDSRSSAVAAPSTGVVADGVTLSTITVTVRDVRGNPVPGRTVELAATGTGNTLVQPAAGTDAAGQATGTLASTVAEMKVVTATVDPGPGEVVLLQTPSIEFVGDLSSLSASLSRAFAVPSTGVTADGVETAAVYVYVRDANDNPVPGVTVAFTASGGGNTATQPAEVTDANGLATGSLASTVAELKTLTITADPAGSAVLLDREPTVLFVADSSTISAALSTAVASPDTGVVADGSAASTITVTVRDANGNPVAGRSVELAASGAGNTLTQPAAITDASGVATGSLASTVAEEKTVTATIDPGPGEVVVAQHPTVEFVSAGVPSASVSSVAVDLAAGVAADGVEAVTITVTVRDELGNPLAGETVALAATGTGNALTQPAAVTDASGVTTGTLASSAAEHKTITAIVDPGGAGVALDDAPSVEFAWALGDTYYVRTGGVDPGGCSGGTSPATAWATLAQAASCVSPGDTVYVGAGTYVGTVTLTTPGAAGAPIRFIADTTGAFTGDAGEVVVDGAVGAAALHLSGADWNELHGFTVIGASGAGPPCGGILVEGASVLLRDNVVYGNVGGIYVSGVDSVVVESNRVSGNLGAASSGIVLDGADGAIVRNNLVYDSGLHGVAILSGTVGALVEGNTLYGNAGDGVHCDVVGETVTLRDNLICDSGDDGIEQVAGTVVTTYNDVFGSGDLDYAGGVVAGTGDLSTDPLFVDVDGADDQLGGAEGADDDFRLDEVAPSAAIDAGSTDAASSVLVDGTTLAERTTREDDGLDGEGGNGATVDLGYHYEVSGEALDVLESGDLRLACGAGVARRLLLRGHDLSAGSWSSTLLGPPTGGVVRWTVSEPSPLECEEELLAVLAEDAAATDLRLLRWTGDTWLTDWRSTSIALADAKRRGFDLAYEASGEALVVHSDGTSTPVYRTLVAGDWSEEASLPLNDGGGPYPDTNGGVVTWVELVPRPGADEVALLFCDDADDLVVIVWDGDQWITAGAETLETSLSVNAASGEVENRVFDAAYEEATGDLLVAWGQHGTNGFWWRTQATGSTAWSVAARVAATPGGGPPHFLDLASEPGSERIAAGSFKLGSTSEQLGLATWSGSGWVHASELDAQIRDSNGAQTGDSPGAVAWLGTTGQAVCVYSDDAGGALDWASWSASVGWELRADVPVAGKDVTESVLLVRRGNRSLLLALLSDAAGELWAASYDGVDWTFTPAGAAVLSGISGADTVPFAAGVRGD